MAADLTDVAVVRKAQAETRPCIITGCDAQLPVRVSCVPQSRHDDTYAVVIDVDPAALLTHLSAHRHTDRGSAPVAVVLAVCIFGALLFLAAVTAGQRAMCASHHDQLRYCADYQETAR